MFPLTILCPGGVHRSPVRLHVFVNITMSRWCPPVSSLLPEDFVRLLVVRLTILCHAGGVNRSPVRLLVVRLIILRHAGGVLPLHLYIPRQDDLPHRRDDGSQRTATPLQLRLLLRKANDR
jgi:hypothetical protein